MHRLAGALCVVVLVSLPAVAAAQVIPLADCVTQGADSTQLQAWFGYRNTSPTTVSMAAGADNLFVPAPPFRGQPTTFMPGEFHRVFAVEFPADGRITWVLSLVEAPADASLPSCDLPLSWLGGWDAAATYERNQIVAYVGSAWIAVRRNVNQPPEDGADWELLARKGEPGAQGVQGERGQAGEPGPAGVQGPPGVPGITPAFPASPVFTVPRNGRLTIADPNVQEDSVVIAIYVGGLRAGDDGRHRRHGGGDDDEREAPQGPAVIEIISGQITIVATPEKRIRYVVFK
jgi:hypothetical protein